MPKIRINPRDVTGRTSVPVSTTSEPRTGGLWDWWYNYKDAQYNTLVTTISLKFAKSLREYIPENAYPTGLTVYFYLITGEIGSSQTYYIDLEQRHTFQHYNSAGYNSIRIEGSNLPDLSQVSSLGVKPNAPECLELRFRGPSLGTDRLGHDVYDYSMPTKYVYEFYALNSSYPPYIELEYAYYPPQSGDGLNPNAVTVNPRLPIKFTWNSLIDQRQFELQHRISGGSWQSVVEKTSNRFYDMPANTITATSGLVEWRVRVMEESGVYSEWSTASFTIGVVPQEPPRIVRPTGDYIKNGTPITFEWAFIANTTEEQTAYEMEIQLLNETKTFSGTTEQRRSVELGITDSVVVYWRVRVKNQFDEWSDWTEKVSFQTVGVPPAPQIISIENNNKPLIKWNSREQESYQITVEDVDGNVIYKTGNILGATTKQHKLKEFLPNGKYLFKLKITNAYGIESEETEYTHIIDPTPIDQPTINLYKSDFFVEVSSTSLDGEVLRDGKIIGNLKLGKFRDYTGANYKTYSYQIRVFENDVAGLSEKVGGVTEFGEINTLATVDNLSNCFKISYGLDEPVTKIIDYSVQGTEVQLEGRKYPFVEFSSHSTAGFSLSFYVETLEQVKELKALVDQRKEFLLRESRGKNIQGVLYGFSAEYHTLGYKISCTMTATGEDYD